MIEKTQGPDIAEEARLAMKGLIEYTTTIINGGVLSGNYLDNCLNDVIKRIVYFMRYNDGESSLERSEITVCVDGSDLFTVHKKSNNSIDDFLFELCIKQEELESFCATKQ